MTDSFVKQPTADNLDSSQNLFASCLSFIRRQKALSQKVLDKKAEEEV